MREDPGPTTIIRFQPLPVVARPTIVIATKHAAEYNLEKLHDRSRNPTKGRVTRGKLGQ
jgi:hypothetical protein